MKGLELALGYYTDIVLPLFTARFPELLDKLAFGLAGPGSDCFGFDDRVSRDHDWGPRVCIWLPEELYQESSSVLQDAYDGLEQVYQGFGPIHRLDTRLQRDGVLSIQRFYRSYIGTDRIPTTNRDWLVIPEESLSLCTNGEIFSDPLGEFSSIRRELLAYYPRDIILKKLACRLKDAGQSGQYNLWRSLQRKDALASAYFRQQFLIDASSILYIVNRKFRPFKKWLFRGLRDFGDEGVSLTYHLESVLAANEDRALKTAVLNTVELLVKAIADFGLVTTANNSLYDYGVELENCIADRELREELYTID